MLPEDQTNLIILGAIGLLASFQQFSIAFSHQLAPATLLAPLRYLSVPFGIAAGVMIYAESLTIEIVFGSALIVLSSIFILRRERERQNGA